MSNGEKPITECKIDGIDVTPEIFNIVYADRESIQRLEQENAEIGGERDRYRLLYESLQARNEELKDAIQKWLDGDYPNPRRNRPHDCMHGVGYWQSCENCETEYWQSVLDLINED